MAQNQNAFPDQPKIPAGESASPARDRAQSISPGEATVIEAEKATAYTPRGEGDSISQIKARLDEELGPPLPIRWDRVEQLRRSPIHRTKRFVQHVGERLLRQG